jgi:hypothetical protein
MTGELLGDKHFNGVTQELASRVSKNSLGRGIDHDDFALPVDHHHGNRRSLDDEPETPLAVAHVLIFGCVEGSHRRHLARDSWLRRI